MVENRVQFGNVGVRQARGAQLSLLLVSLTAASLHAQPTGQIQGTVLTEAGQPVVRAVVTATRGFVAGSPAAKPASAMTGEDGSFTLEGLAAGSYVICPQLPGSDLLNPCQWSAERPKVTLAGAQKVSGMQIRMKRGLQVRVRVDDVAQLLPANEKPGAGVHLQVGVWTSQGLFYPASVVSRDKQGRTHGLAVPFDTPLRLSVTRRKLQVDDERGVRVRDTDPPVPFQVRTGDTQKLFRFRVVGVQN